jgi:hypothetical protein
MWKLFLATKLIQKVPAIDAKLSLAGAGWVIHSAMYDFAIAGTRFLPKGFIFLYNNDVLLKRR